MDTGYKPILEEIINNKSDMPKNIYVSSAIQRGITVQGLITKCGEKLSFIGYRGGKKKNLNKAIESASTWSLTETLTGLAVILALYLFLVTKWLPSYMKNRPPYKLKRLLSVYNAFQVAYSIYLVFITRNMYSHKSTERKRQNSVKDKSPVSRKRNKNKEKVVAKNKEENEYEIDVGYDEYARYIFRYGVITTRCPKGVDLDGVISEIYPYFIAKHLDLLDTVFFVLRKKDNQVSFLHLYHHTAMVSWTWLHYMYHPTDHFVVVGLLNSFVHVLMYAYYGISSMGPEYQKYVWWKKHLTKVQLVQFILVISHLHYQQKLTPCKIPNFFHYYCMTSIGSFFILFLNFYFKSYRKRMVKRDLEVIGKDSLNIEYSGYVSSKVF